MAKKTKNTIANSTYGEDFEYLSAGQQAAVTKKYNKQTGRASSGSVSTILAKIGRVGNGVKEQVLAKGETVADLVEQAKFTVDDNKESVIAQSTGLSVNLGDTVKSGETYVITPEIKSA